MFFLQSVGPANRETERERLSQSLIRTYHYLAKYYTPKNQHDLVLDGGFARRATVKLTKLHVFFFICVSRHTYPAMK